MSRNRDWARSPVFPSGSEVARQHKLDLFLRRTTVKKYSEIRMQSSSTKHFIIDLKSSREEIDSQVLHFAVLNCTVDKV